MNKKNYKKILGVLGILGFAILISFFIRGQYIRNKIHNSNCSTIGETLRYETYGRGGKNIVYEYSVNGKNYEGYVSPKDNAVVPGGKYLVKYLCDDPKESIMYFDKPWE